MVGFTNDYQIYQNTDSIGNDITSLATTDQNGCQIACNNLDTSALRKVWINAEIDLGKSIVDEKPCPLYHIVLAEAIGETKIIECTVCDDFVVIQEIKDTKAACNCH
jgi:hypothetical protein